MDFYLITGLFLAYLIGSIPTSVWLGKAFFNKDVRQYGSKNPGASNTFRVLGKQAGSIVLILDILKAYLATHLPYFSTLISGQELNNIMPFSVLAGTLAVFGHIFPVFLRFKGGKGIASLLGMLIALHPAAAGICFGVFFIVFIISHFVSLSSMAAALVFPLLLFFGGMEPNGVFVKIFSLLVLVLVIYTHRTNIERLRKGEENKLYLRKSSK